MGLLPASVPNAGYAALSVFVLQVWQENQGKEQICRRLDFID